MLSVILDLEFDQDRDIFTLLERIGMTWQLTG